MFSLRAIAAVGGLTLLSRALGFLREMLTARLLGTGPVAEAFFVAMRLPNLFRQIFAEGAFNAAFVPIFARQLEEEGQASARRFAEQSLAVLLLVLLGLTALAQFLMPWLIRLFAPGFFAYPEKFQLAVLFTVITFPYLLFMSLTALQGGILNALGRFGPAAAAPILLNVAMIVSLAFLAPRSAAPGEVLAWTVPVAGLLQFLWLFLACRRAGMDLRLPRPRLTPAVGRLFRLMIPGIVGGGVNQINLAIATILASLQAQAVSFLYYADRLYQLPLALIGSAIGVVLLPSLTRAIRGGRPEEAMRAQNRAVEIGLLLSLPATAFLLAAAHPAIAALYQRGAFTAADADAVALALPALAAGLPAYVLNKALAPAFLAREDTMSPFRFAMIGVAADIAIALSLFPWLGYVGIALGTAGAAWVNAALLFGKLRRRDYFAPDARLKRVLPRLALSTLLMAGAVCGLRFMLPPAATSWQRLGDLVILFLAGAVAYGAALLLTGAVRLKDLRPRADGAIS